jgi:hypothetical protein
MLDELAGTVQKIVLCAASEEANQKPRVLPKTIKVMK